MQIAIARSGGLTGELQEEVARLNTQELDPARGREIEACIRELETQGEQFGTDMVRYDIDVTDERSSRRLTILDEQDPNSPLHRLLALAGSG